LELVVAMTGLIGEVLEQSTHAIIEVLLPHFSGENNESHEKPQSG
jgi:hypothetical protein